MPLERSALPLARLALCLSLLAATAGFAQESKALPPTRPAPAEEIVSPPLVPAEEPPAQPAPRGELFPHEQRNTGSDAARFGRLVLQPPAGILAGGVGALALAIPVGTVAFFACDAGFATSRGSKCFEAVTYSALAVGGSLGAGFGVLGVGYLLNGKARAGVTMGGALAGSAVGGTLMLLSGKQGLGIPYLVVAPALGATLAYAISDAFFPETSRAVPPAHKPEDEYARVLPMLSPTQTGGIIGGLVGRF